MSLPLPEIFTNEHPLPSLLFRLILKLLIVTDPLVSVNTLLLDENELGTERVVVPSLFSNGLISTVYSLKDISDVSLECVPFSNLSESEVDPIVSTPTLNPPLTEVHAVFDGVTHRVLIPADPHVM